MHIVIDALVTFGDCDESKCPPSVAIKRGLCELYTARIASPRLSDDFGFISSQFIQVRGFIWIDISPNLQTS